MRRPIILALALLAASPCAAQQVAVYETVEEEEVVVDAGADPGADRFVAAAPTQALQGIARYGPFRVLDGQRAALVDVTDSRSPAAFAAMLAAFPGIARLEMVECPGTEDDTANLRLGRMIRARGIETHVPDGGSVRSGAVELFLAGARRMADRGAEFAVHSWRDEDGKEAADFAADAPVNRTYLAYYREMGMSEIEARAFYDMTNSVPNAQARWMTTSQMGQWVRLEKDGAVASRTLDSGRALR